jgi:hypothetical protein
VVFKQTVLSGHNPIIKYSDSKENDRKRKKQNTIKEGNGIKIRPKRRRKLEKSFYCNI